MTTATIYIHAKHELSARYYKEDGGDWVSVKAMVDSVIGDISIIFDDLNVARRFLEVVGNAIAENNAKPVEETHHE